MYVGNQYNRDSMFDTFFAPAAAVHRHRVAGKWTNTTAWPHINFTGRVGFADGQALHGDAMATVLLLPENYARTGHMTHRLPEAVLAGCLPIGPVGIHDLDEFVPDALHAIDGEAAANLVTGLLHATTGERSALVASCLPKLEQFRSSTQTTIINDHLHR